PYGRATRSVAQCDECVAAPSDSHEVAVLAETVARRPLPIRPAIRGYPRRWCGVATLVAGAHEDEAAAGCDYSAQLSVALVARQRRTRHSDPCLPVGGTPDGRFAHRLPGPQ